MCWWSCSIVLSVEGILLCVCLMLFMAAERIAHVLLQHVGEEGNSEREKKYIQKLVHMLKRNFSGPKQ